jgi:hypothetical protein
MSVSLTVASKVVLGLVLLGAIVLSVRARAPRRGLHGTDLRCLVASALGLYLVGGAAWLTHHIGIAVLVYAAGIATAALAAWLSRGGEWREPPDEPSDEPPAPWGPDLGDLGFDWDRFESDLRDYLARAGDPVGRGAGDPVGV